MILSMPATASIGCSRPWTAVATSEASARVSAVRAFWNIDIRGLPEGTPIKVQYETSKAEPGRATIHRICPRVDGTPMDIVASQVGVIDHINREKSLIHVVVARGVDGICPISLYPSKAKIGDAVAVRLAQHHSKSGVRTRIVEIEPTDQAPSSDVCRPFCDTTNVTPNGLGFTRGDIFIPPHMITAEGIQPGDLVDGIAIASFDKKRGKWGSRKTLCLAGHLRKNAQSTKSFPCLNPRVKYPASCQHHLQRPNHDVHLQLRRGPQQARHTRNTTQRSTRSMPHNLQHLFYGRPPDSF